MKFRTSFILSVHLMAFASFQALIQTHELPLIFTIFILAMISVSLIYNLKYKTFYFSKSVVNGALVAAGILFLTEWLFWSRSLLMASTHFLNILLIIKLFTLKRAKDYIQLFLVSFLQVLAASAMSIHIAFAFSLLLYLMMATWGMILYQMKAEIEERNRLYGFQEKVPETFESEEVVTLPLILTTIGVGMISFIFTLLIFFLIPRMGAGLFQKSEKEEIRTSGFSEKAEFGSLAPIKLDPTVVMRVSMSSAPLKVYIKGTSFNVYDGKEWKNTLRVQKTLKSGEEIPYQGLYRGEITQEYLIEPMDTMAIFALAQPVQLDSQFHLFNQDQMGNLSMQANQGNRLAYKVTSSVPVLLPADQELKIAQIPQQEGGQSFIEFSFPDRNNLIELSQKASERAVTLLEKTIAVQSFLKNNYSYSLSVSPSRERSPMEDFLFYQKKGYCEHFATAMVLMLRSLGIPSRMATGYSPEEWNPYGNYFKVRQSDAHAWVEVYFPSSGWITFDPTPEGRANPQALSFIDRLKKSLFPVDQFADSLKLKWDRYVIHYSMTDQLELASSFQKKGIMTGEILKEKFNEVISRFPQYGRKVVPYLLVALGFILLWIVKKKFYPVWLENISSRRTEDETVVYYLGLLQILSRYHLHKRAHQTPYEFLSESVEALRRIGEPFYSGAEWLTDIYYKSRFGGTSISEEEKKKTQDILKRLKEFSTLPRQS